MTDQLTTLHALNVKYGDVVHFDIDGKTGKYTIGRPYKVSDLNAHARIWRIVSRASDTPTIWADMTPEEKGALLLAQFEHKPIEMFADGPWQVCTPSWRDDRAYRIKPEPKRETVKLYGRNHCFEFKHNPNNTDTHSITFETIDGEPDCGTIRMERLT
jgi:hypothetical protein